MHDNFARTAKIVGLGAYLPERVLSNNDLEQIVETTDEWITTRTGIKERRVVADGESLVDLVERAGRSAMEDAGVAPDEVDLLILATATVEQPIPASAAIAQPRLGLSNAVCFDLSAACSGFTYSLNVARQFIATGEAHTVLVIGAECLTRYLDWTDRTTCVLFGDGAAGVVLQPAAQGEGILQIEWRTDGSLADLIAMPGGGCRCPPHSTESIEQRLPFIKMRGNETFKVAVRALADLSNSILDKAGMREDQSFSNVHRVGNTSAASIPLAMAEARDAGRLRRGDLVLTSSFGGGLTWASALFRF
jgi:3-oxoacyl-[acyl-carrier-protein] synthase-3